MEKRKSTKSSKKEKIEKNEENSISEDLIAICPETKYILNPSFLTLFKEVNVRNIMTKRKGKSNLQLIGKIEHFHQKKMAKIEKGNKRYLMENKKIAILPLIYTKNKKLLKKYSKIITESKLLMENYFEMEVRIVSNEENISNYNMSIKKKSGEFSIFEKNNNTECPLIYDKETDSFDVLRLLDILIDYVKSDFSLLVFTDLKIYEWEPSNQVFGRAYGGNGIALVTLSEENDREVLITAVHETLHTFGFDHCTHWDCLMNAKNDEEYSSISLCPTDLMGLKIFNQKINFPVRFEKLLKTYELLNWEKDVIHTKQILDFLNN